MVARTRDHTLGKDGFYGETPNEHFHFQDDRRRLHFRHGVASSTTSPPIGSQRTTRRPDHSTPRRCYASFADVGRNQALAGTTLDPIVKGAKGRRDETVRRRGRSVRGLLRTPGRLPARPAQDNEEHKEVRAGPASYPEDGYVVTNNHVIDGADRSSSGSTKEKYRPSSSGKDRSRT